MNIVSIPRHVAGHVIGKRGQRILQIQEQTGTRIRSENVDDLCNFHLEAETQEHLNHAKTLITEIVNDVETRNHREKPPLFFVIIDYPEDACDNTAGAILRLHFQPIPECPAILTVQRQMYRALLCPFLPNQEDTVPPTPLPTISCFNPRVPKPNSFCTPTAIPHCLDTVAREIAKLIRRPLQVTLNLRVGRQLFNHRDPIRELPRTVDVSEMCMKKIGEPFRIMFQNGVDDAEAAVLIDWLVLEGFVRERREAEELGVVNVFFPSTRDDINVTATLQWDEYHGTWKQTKLQKDHRRNVVLTFFRASADRLDFRLLLSSKYNHALHDYKFDDYLRDVQRDLPPDQRRHIRFGPTAELKVNCVRYKMKRRFRNDRFKVVVTTVEQGQLGGRPGRTLEISIAHQAWRRLKFLTHELEPHVFDGSYGFCGTTRAVAKVAQEAVEAVQETLEFARRLCRVLGERRLCMSEEN